MYSHINHRNCELLGHSKSMFDVANYDHNIIVKINKNDNIYSETLKFLVLPYNAYETKFGQQFTSQCCLYYSYRLSQKAVTTVVNLCLI